MLLHVHETNLYDVSAQAPKVYSFVIKKERVMATGMVRYWLCSATACKGKVAQRAGQYKRSGVHNHAADPNAAIK